MELRRHSRRRAAENNDAAAGAYYASVSRRAALAKWAVVIAIPVFLVIMFGAYGSNITYDNLNYLLRDFSSDRTGISADFTNVSFESQTTLDAAMFKGELAIVGSSSAVLYNSTGDKTFSYKSGMENPVVIPTEKYLFAYDLGGTRYSIFSNLKRVLDTDADAVIENASMSEKGSFLLVKRARDAKHTVSVYDSSFNHVVDYHRSRFVADAELSPNGKRLVIVTVGNEGADLSSVVEVFEVKATEPLSRTEGRGYLPVRLEYFSDGSFALVCDTRIVFYDPDGTELSTYYQDNSRLICADKASDSLCVVYSGSITGPQSEFFIFDNRGNIIYNVNSERKLSFVTHNDGYVFALGTDGVFRFDRSDDSVCFEKCDADTRSVLAIEDFALAVSVSGAKCVFGSAGEYTEIETTNNTSETEGG